MAIAFHSYRNRLVSFRLICFAHVCVARSLTLAMHPFTQTHPFVRSRDFQFPAISHQQWLANKLNYRYKYHHHHRRHSLAWIHTRYCCYKHMWCVRVCACVWHLLNMYQWKCNVDLVFALLPHTHLYTV